MKTVKQTIEFLTHKDGQIYSDETGKTVALIPYYDKGDGPLGNLLAAAPELLEALTTLWEDVKADRYNYRLATMRKVEDAIQKATNP